MFATYRVVNRDGTPYDGVMPDPHTIHEMEVVDVRMVTSDPREEAKLVISLAFKELPTR